MSYGQVSLSDLSLNDICLIVGFYRTMEVVMVVIIHHQEVLEDMAHHHLLEDMERMQPRLDMEEEE